LLFTNLFFISFYEFTGEREYEITLTFSYYFHIGRTGQFHIAQLSILATAVVAGDELLKIGLYLAGRQWYWAKKVLFVMSSVCLFAKKTGNYW